MPITKPVVNGSSGTWGTILNAALDDLDGRLTTATATNATQDTNLTNVTSRVSNAETNITSLQANVGTSYSSRAALPGSANNGTKAVTTDSGLTWTYFNGYWYPPPGTITCALVQANGSNTMPAGTATVVQFDTTRSTFVFNSYSTGTQASFVCQNPGWYTISGGVSFQDTVNGVGYRQAMLYKGTSFASAAAVTGSSNSCAPNNQGATATGVSTRTVTIFVAAGERVYLFGNHSAQTSLNTSTLQSFYSTLNVVFAGWYPTS